MEQVLLQAIRDNPADELSWLALGDWLEEQGDRRGEILRRSLRLRKEPAGVRRLLLEAEMTLLLMEGILPCVPEIVNSVGMRLVLIPPGTFWMGNQETEERSSSNDVWHQVEITRPIYMGVFTVTQEQYERVRGHNPSIFAPSGIRGAEVAQVDTSTFPVENISWEAAAAFCVALSKLPVEAEARRTYRLPSEAEWEYACRAGTTTETPFGDTLSSRQANFNGTSPLGNAAEGPNLGRTCPVGMFPPNAFGLYDLLGNVWEWCADWYAEDTYRIEPRRDPQGPEHGEHRVLRGGSCWSSGSVCRSGHRGAFGPSACDATTGFRVVMDQG